MRVDDEGMDSRASASDAKWDGVHLALAPNGCVATIAFPPCFDPSMEVAGDHVALERADRLTRIESLCARAVANGARIIVLPECSVVHCPVYDEDMTEAIEPIGDGHTNATISWASSFAAQNAVYMVMGVAERTDRGNVHSYVRAMLIDADDVDDVDWRVVHSSLALNGCGEMLKEYAGLPIWVSQEEKVSCFESEMGRVGICCGIGEIANDEGERTILDLHLLLCCARTSTAGAQEELLERIHQATESRLTVQTIVSGWQHMEGDKCICQAESASEVEEEERVRARALCKSFVSGEASRASRCECSAIGVIQYYPIESSPSGFVLPKRVAASDPVPAGHVRVALLQHSSDLCRTDANGAKMEELAREAARNGARFLVFPEASLTGYLSQDLRRNWCIPGRSNNFPIGVDPSPHALTLESPAVKRFVALAGELGVYMVPYSNIIDTAAARVRTHAIVLQTHEQQVIPFVEKAEPDDLQEVRYYNTAILCSPEGEVVAHYRKNNPWPRPEVSWATAGDDVACYDTEYGRVGLAICFDIHEMRQKYKPCGIWALLYPIAWVDANPLSLWFHTILPKRMEAFPFHLVGCNWSVDRYQEWQGYGYSTVIDEHSTVIACAEGIYGSQVTYAHLPVSASAEPSRTE